MIRIDHISFGFAVPSEDFAHNLYADWDGFCRHCFERVAEECLAPYGNDKALYELERLDLDLGSIPEENFYDEYPRRLREALLAALPPLYGTRMQPDPERTVAARIDNLLHYLKYGHPQPEWADKTFDPQEETDWLAGQPAAFYYSAIEKLASLCAEDGHAARSLLWQTAGGKLLLDLYTAILALPSAGLQRKRRFLALLLEARPDIPLRFVHGTQDGNGLHGMAELLDSPSVRTLMREEAGEHAEVDLPPYWHYLYEWLIRYYPFNGVAIFGGKAEFTRHLHHRLLTFIRKRNYSFYLSKAELTVSFLLEVFGPAYYIDVLNAIYELQPHNPDGSPVYDNYFNRELYRMFLRLSLLRLPGTATSPDVPGTNKEKEESIPTDAEALTLWLKDALHNEAEKRTLLATLAKEQPELLIGWLQSIAMKDDTLLPLLVSLIDDTSINRLLASLSFAAVEKVSRTWDYIERHKAENTWLRDISDTTLRHAFRKSVLRWIGNGHSDLTEEVSVGRLLQALHEELGRTGNADNENEKEIENLAAAIRTETPSLTYPLDAERLTGILKDTARSEAYKRMLLMTLAKEQPELLIGWLQTEATKDDTLLSLLAPLADDAVINRLLVSLSFAGIERVSRIWNYIGRHKVENDHLKDISETALLHAFHKSVLSWIGNGHYSLDGKESVRELLLALYGELGITNDTNQEIESLTTDIRTESPSLPYPMDTERLTDILKDTARSEAYKRMLLMVLAKEQPELLIGWLQTEATKDDALLSLLAPLADDTVINRLLVSVSFTASETAEAVKKHLQRHRAEIPWLEGITGTRLEQAVRQSVLRWLAEADLNRADATETLLQIFCQEATGKSDDTAVGELAAELKLPESRREHAPVKESGTEKYMEHLRAVLSGASMPEAMKRREAARFWDTYREDYPEAVRLLHTQKLLPGMLELTGHYAYMEIMRKALPQAWGGEKAETLLPLLEWLVRNEETLSPYLADKSTGLRTQLLLWIVRQGQGTANARSLLAGLFGGANLPPVLGLMTRDIDSEEFIDIENILARWQSSLPSAYKEWLHVMEDDTRAVRILQESRWQTAEDFGEWLGDTAIPDGKKRKLLRTAATEYSQKWTTLLRGFGKEGKDIRRIAVHLPASVLLQSIGRGSFHQAAVLSRLVSLTERHAETFPFLFAEGKDFQSALSEALLLYMQDADTLERTLTEKDIVEKFLACLHFVHTGKREYTGDAGWQQLSDILNNAMGTEGQSGQEEEMSEILSGMDNGDTAWRHKLETLLYRQPDKLLAWVESVATDKEIDRLTDTASMEWLTQWAGYLPTVAGFAHPDAFRHWTAWLLRLAASGIVPAKELATALCAWVKGTDWRHRTPQQLEGYFLSKLHIGDMGGIALPLEYLTDASLPETIRKRLLQDFLRLHPDKLLEYIRQTTAQGIMSIGQWIGMLDTDGWMRLASGLSLSATELLRQVSGILHLDDEAECLAWATCVIKEDRETWLYNRPEEHVRPFVQAAMPRQGEAEKKEALIQVLEKLHIVETEDTEQEPEIIWVSNAGLCLLAPWFVCLFAMLGYLDEERKTFKDTASKVRAVFLLQYLSCGQERDWREPELAFSRLLTALPGNVPLPKRLALSKEERQTADGMVTGVKANWPKMDGTSVEGFRRSFLLRGGTLEQEEGRWLLTVEEKAYDILLETIPWGFRQVRLPWLKKYVQVKWHEKQEF